MTGDTKVCPYCAEEIKAAAILCRYCGMSLNEGVPNHLKQPSTPQKQFGKNFLSVSEEEQKIKVEIGELPINLKPKLPVTIIAEWDSSGKVQFNLKSRGNIDRVTISRLLAVSVPLITYHQFITLSPSFVLKYIGFLTFLYKQASPTIDPVNPALKSVEIDLELNDEMIIPQFRPTFKMFTSSNRMEESVIQFLLNYQVSVFSLLSNYLKTSVKISVLDAANTYLSMGISREFYVMTLGTNTWWKNEIKEEYVDTRLEMVTTWFKGRSSAR